MLLKRKLKNREFIIKDREFPKIYTNRCKNNIALIGIGGNIGDVYRRFKKLLVKFKRDRLVDIVATSVLYKNPPFGYLDQPYFLNGVILISTKLSPVQLLRYLLGVEKYFRRKRAFKDSPRTLDLDILLYKDLKIDKPYLSIPHKGFGKRKSIEIPLKSLKGVACLKRVL